MILWIGPGIAAWSVVLFDIMFVSFGPIQKGFRLDRIEHPTLHVMRWPSLTIKLACLWSAVIAQVGHQLSIVYL